MICYICVRENNDLSCLVNENKQTNKHAVFTNGSIVKDYKQSGK